MTSITSMLNFKSCLIAKVWSFSSVIVQTRFFKMQQKAKFRRIIEQETLSQLNNGRMLKQCFVLMFVKGINLKNSV